VLCLNFGIFPHCPFIYQKPIAARLSYLPCSFHVTGCLVPVIRTTRGGAFDVQLACRRGHRRIYASIFLFCYSGVLYFVFEVVNLFPSLYVTYYLQFCVFSCCSKENYYLRGGLRGLSWNFLATRLVQTVNCFYGSRRFITVLTETHQWTPVQSSLSKLHFSKINFY
jgi:hypothetical protein